MSGKTQGRMDHRSACGYEYASSDLNCSHEYLLPALSRLLRELGGSAVPRRIFDLGCGNGSVAAYLADRDFGVVGVDPSRQGIERARGKYPELDLQEGSCYDDLVAKYGQFPIVLSLEVVEHVYAPRRFAECLFELLEPGGTAIVSTPFHGYWKNLALAMTGRLDNHFTALWDHGHIKFWSRKTLGTLLEEAGFERIRCLRVGRIPALAKSMIAIARRPK